jgi:hypothetical protein
MSSSIDDDRDGSSAAVEDDRGPWWANDPELIARVLNVPKQLLHRRFGSRSLDRWEQCTPGSEAVSASTPRPLPARAREDRSRAGPRS